MVGRQRGQAHPVGNSAEAGGCAKCGWCKMVVGRQRGQAHLVGNSAGAGVRITNGTSDCAGSDWFGWVWSGESNSNSASNINSDSNSNSACIVKSQSQS